MLKPPLPRIALTDVDQDGALAGMLFKIMTSTGKQLGTGRRLFPFFAGEPTVLVGYLRVVTGDIAVVVAEDDATLIQRLEIVRSGFLEVFKLKRVGSTETAARAVATMRARNYLHSVIEVSAELG